MFFKGTKVVKTEEAFRVICFFLIEVEAMKRAADAAACWVRRPVLIIIKSGGGGELK